MPTQTIQRSRRLAVNSITPLLIAVLLLVGCGGSDDPTGPAGGSATALALNDLVGSWKATSVIHTDKSNSSQTFDVIAEGGEVRFTMLPNTGTRTWTSFGDVSDEWDSAVSLSGNVLTVTPVEAGRPSRTWTISLSNNVLTMTDSDSMWDFTLSGAPPVSTVEVIVFARN